MAVRDIGYELIGVDGAVFCYQIDVCEAAGGAFQVQPCFYVFYGVAAVTGQAVMYLVEILPAHFNIGLDG